MVKKAVVSKKSGRLSDIDENDAESLAYNVRVGDRLRSIRRQKKLSLQGMKKLQGGVISVFVSDIPAIYTGFTTQAGKPR